MIIHSRAGYVHANGTISSIYVDYDGHYEELGNTLLEHYNSLKRAEEIVALGDAVTLEATLEESVFFSRDYGEPDSEAELSKNLDEFYQSCRNCGVFLAYLWIDGGWLTMTVTPEKPSLAVANRPHELSEEATTRLREIANGTSTIKIELIAAPLWERPDALTPLKDEFKKTT